MGNRMDLHFLHEISAQNNVIGCKIVGYDTRDTSRSITFITRILDVKPTSANNLQLFAICHISLKSRGFQKNFTLFD